MVQQMKRKIFLILKKQEKIKEKKKIKSSHKKRNREDHYFINLKMYNLERILLITFS